MKALGMVFTNIFLVHLEDQKVEWLKIQADKENVLKQCQNVCEIRKLIHDNYMLPECQNDYLEFTDLDTISERFEKHKILRYIYRNMDRQWIEVSAIVQNRDKDGRVTDILFLTHDVTDQRERELQQEDALRLALASAEHANKAKTAFLNNMSHDIRTPMNALLGYSELMKRELTDPKLLEFHLKSHGRTLWEFANGIGDAKVQSEETAAKGVGNSTTLPKDVEKAEDAKKVLFSLAESVGKRLRKAGQKANMVSVEIRYSDFQNVSHQKQLGRASGADQVIYEAACSLFDELWNGEPIRLLGVRTAKLVDEDEPEQLSLFDLQFEVKSEKPKKSMEKLKKLSAAMGEIRGKYGADAVIRGSVLEQREKEKKYEKKQF